MKFILNNKAVSIGILSVALVSVVAVIYVIFAAPNNDSSSTGDNTVELDPTKGGDKQSFSNTGEPEEPKSGSNSGESQNNGKLPVKPYGDFVSTHSTQAGANATINSVCHTSPGATCIIRFTNAGEVKSLDAKTTDSDGTAQWYWSLNDIGITAGTWVVEAVAESNGEKTTTTDPIKLEVSS